jgi:superfamily II DNA or RNA helicase
MDITNRQKCFWRKAAVLSPEQMMSGPFACTLDSGNLSVATKSHLVITNVHQLATNVDKWLTQFPDDFFDMIIVDEAHHSAAASWQKVIDRFPKAKVILLTATPFRSERQELDGELVFRYPFRNATLKGYIKRLKASYVAPSTIELGFTDASGRTYTLDEVLELKREDWFSRGVALARLCNQHIVDSSCRSSKSCGRAERSTSSSPLRPRSITPARSGPSTRSGDSRLTSSTANKAKTSRLLFSRRYGMARWIASFRCKCSAKGSTSPG